METKLFDTETREGKLLYVAICALLDFDNSKDFPTLLAELEQGVEALEKFKM